MLKRAGLVLVVVVAGCGGGGDGTASFDASSFDAAGADAAATDDASAVDAPIVEIDAPLIDAPIDAPAVSCNPLSPPGAQGCAAGQKCTWVQISDFPDNYGRIGCVPDGEVPLGGACVKGVIGEATGYDDCGAGGICIGSTTSGTCRDMCAFDRSQQALCPSGEACARQAGLGANGSDDPVIGACAATCDPLEQTRLVNGVEESCGAGQGCYLLASTIDTIAVCAPAGTPRHNEPITGATYANSCAPGHVPRLAVQGGSGNECAALCKPADVYSGHNDGRNGQPTYEGGDTRETNWLGLPATCASVGGDTVLPGVTGTGETCTFYWTREPAENLTAFSNTIGWCFNVASWRYDPDGIEPINNTTPYPRCVQDGVSVGVGQPAMTTADLIPPINATLPHNDAVYFGCMALPTTLRGGARSVKRTMPPVRLDTLGP